MIEAHEHVRSIENIYTEEELKAIAEKIIDAFNKSIYPRTLSTDLCVSLAASLVNGIGLIPSILLPHLEIENKSVALTLGCLAALPIWALASQVLYKNILQLTDHWKDTVTLGFRRRREIHVNKALPYSTEVLSQSLLLAHGLGAALVCAYTGFKLLKMVHPLIPLPPAISYPAAILNAVSAFSTNTRFLDDKHQAWLNKLAAEETNIEDRTIRFWQDQHLSLLENLLDHGKIEGTILANFIADYFSPPEKISSEDLLHWQIYQLEQLALKTLHHIDFKFRILAEIEKQIGVVKLHHPARRIALFIDDDAQRIIVNLRKSPIKIASPLWSDTASWIIKVIATIACVNYLVQAHDAAVEDTESLYYISDEHYEVIRYLLALYFGLSAFTVNAIMNNLMTNEVITLLRSLKPWWKRLSIEEKTAAIIGCLFSVSSAGAIGLLSYLFPLVKHWQFALAQGTITALGTLPLIIRALINGTGTCLYSILDRWYGWSKKFNSIDLVYRDAGPYYINIDEQRRPTNHQKLITNYLSHITINLVREVRRQTMRACPSIVKEDMTWVSTLLALGRKLDTRYSYFVAKQSGDDDSFDTGNLPPDDPHDFPNKRVDQLRPSSSSPARRRISSPSNQRKIIELKTTNHHNHEQKDDIKYNQNYIPKFTTRDIKAGLSFFVIYYALNKLMDYINPENSQGLNLFYVYSTLLLMGLCINKYFIQIPDRAEEVPNIENNKQETFLKSRFAFFFPTKMSYKQEQVVIQDTLVPQFTS